MNQVLLKNNAGESVVASIVRCFKYNNDTYMLYTLNEVDASNYIKLYGIKLSMDQSGNIIGSIIEDSVWANVSSLLKEMVKPINEVVNPAFQDLNPSSITNINLVSQRVFKINKEMADLLVANTSVSTQNTSETQNTSNSNINPTLDNTQTEQQITGEYTQNQQAPNETVPQANNQEQNLLDYKQLYENEIANNQQLTNEIQVLKSKIIAIENILKG